MQKRRPVGSGAVLLGGERPDYTHHNPLIQANDAMRGRLARHLAFWPWMAGSVQ